MSRTLPLSLTALLALAPLAGCGSDAEVDGAPVGRSVEGDVSVQSNETAAVAAPPIVADVDTTGPLMVTVAGQTVPTRAVVTDMESGDRSCILTLRRDGGATATVQADYSVCDSNVLIDRRVQIAYEPFDALAPSCGGDPDCLDTETVPLAVVAEPIGPGTVPGTDAR